MMFFDYKGKAPKLPDGLQISPLWGPRGRETPSSSSGEEIVTSFDFSR
jgi:hypothetical protein